jgi:hypothetical protein
MSEKHQLIQDLFPGEKIEFLRGYCLEAFTYPANKGSSYSLALAWAVLEIGCLITASQAQELLWTDLDDLYMTLRGQPIPRSATLALGIFSGYHHPAIRLKVRIFPEPKEFQTAFNLMNWLWQGQVEKMRTGRAYIAKQVRDMWDRGRTTADIERLLKLSHDTVHFILSEYKIERDERNKREQTRINKEAADLAAHINGTWSKPQDDRIILDNGNRIRISKDGKEMHIEAVDLARKTVTLSESDIEKMRRNSVQFYHDHTLPPEEDEGDPNG